jgi:nitrate reductase gamma subunit
MLHYEENKCVWTNNARKINDQKRLLQKNSIEQSLEKFLQEGDSKLKQNILKTKFFTFFRIILLLFHISFYFLLVYYSIIFLNIFNFP